MDWSKVSDAVSILLTRWLSPVNVVLLVSIALFAYMLHKANKRPDFSLVDALRDDAGKASFSRVAYIAAFITSTWCVMFYSVDPHADPHTLVELFVAYVIVWAAPKVLEKYIEARYGRKDGQ